MSNTEGSETPKEWELPEERKFTVADLRKELIPRPWEEADLEAPILAEWTAGKVAKITQSTPDIPENTSSRSQFR